MADQLENIVKVTITRQTRVPSMKSFSEHLVAAEFNPVGINPIFDPAHRVRIFGSMDEVAGAGFPTDSYVYRAASKQFSQSPHIGKLYVGIKMPGGVYDVGASIVGSWVPGNVLHITAAGVPIDDIAFDDNPNSDKMADAVVKAFNENFNTTRAVKVSATELRFYGALLQSEVTITGGATQPAIVWKDNSGLPKIPGTDYQAYPADANWTEALAKIKAANNDWYAISVSARRMDNQQECAQWIQANEKLGILTSGDPTISDEESGDLAAWAKLNNLDRVAVFFHPDAKLEDSSVDELSPLDPIPEAGWFGKMLTKHPGSATWYGKELQSIPSYELQQYQVTNIENKNANWYMTVADVPVTAFGRTGGGEWIDVIHGLDWLKAIIQNYVFTPITQQDKIPFTDAGVQMIESQLRKALVEGVTRQILAEYDISTPAVADVAILMKGERTLPDVKFTGVLAGAIHRIIIDGTITL